MTNRRLNQIFYATNKFDIPSTINTLESFFYDISSLPVNPPILEERQEKEIQTQEKERQTQAKEKEKEIQAKEKEKETQAKEKEKETQAKEKEIQTQEKKNIFEPKPSDSIFWCIFVAIHGYSEYIMIGTRYGNRELEEKQKMITFFKQQPKLLKSTNHKITLDNIQEIYSEYLSFQNETSLLGVIGLSVFYNMRILLVDTSKKIYMDFHSEQPTKTCILIKNKGIRGKTKYAYDMDMTEEYVEKTMLCLHHYTKPLQAISTYKSSDLESIGKLLGIYTEQPNKKVKKQELYQQILEYCGEF
jgi:hypothetical protein